MLSYTTPADGAYQVAVGNIQCTVLVDGAFAYPNPTELLFATAPSEERDAALREQGIDPDEWGETMLPYLCLLIETGEETVLVDTGAGDIAPSTGNLPDVLGSLGVQPSDIDAVVLTHGHPDHVGGLVADGEPRYPDATHYIPTDEHAYWLPEPDLSGLALPEEFLGMMRATAAANLGPLEESGHWQQVDDGQTICPGVTVHAAPGHTPGHAVVEVESDGESLLHLADTVIHPLHVSHLSWAVGFDHQPDRVPETRRSMLDRASDADAALVSHFPEPGLGTVEVTEDGFDWTAPE